MKYAIPNCPECGELLRGESDLTPGCALVTRFEDGSFDYAGETDVFWDGQINRRDISDGTALAGTVEAILESAGYASGEAEPTLRELNVSLKTLAAARKALLDWKASPTNQIVAVQCANGHEWDTKREDEDWKETP
jgi:hypothetical protein